MTPERQAEIEALDGGRLRRESCRRVGPDCPAFGRERVYETVFEHPRIVLLELISEIQNLESKIAEYAGGSEEITLHARRYWVAARTAEMWLGGSTGPDGRRMIGQSYWQMDESRAAGHLVLDALLEG